MEERLRIGIDYDDVLVNTFPSFIDFHNQRYGTKFRIEDMTSYHIWEVGIGKDKHDAVRLFQEFYDSPEFDEMPLVDGAGKGVTELARLSERGVEIITSRPLLFRVKTVRLIRRSFSGIPLTLHYSNDFHDGANHSKASICQELGLDYYVEDCFEYAKDIVQRRTDVLLLKKPWNERDWHRLRKPENGDGRDSRNYRPRAIIPVENWQEILKEIRKSNGGENGISR